MALYDDRYWLLSNIRNSFMSSDDTGICELVMAGEKKLIKDKFFSKEPYPDPDESEDDDYYDDTGSDNIQFDDEYCMNSARLDRSEYQCKKAAEMIHIKWEPKNNLVEDLDDNGQPDKLFIMKQFDDEKTGSKPPKKSALTSLIEQSRNTPVNPYIKYAQYDGSGQIDIPTRKYKIFLTMLPEELRNYPLRICCVATAKIQDLIGLILLKFSTNCSRDYPLKDISNYGLYIGDEDGEVDTDIPNLDPKECIAKFFFTCLGLVEHAEPFKAVSFQSSDEVLASPDTGGGKNWTISVSKDKETKQAKNDMLIMDHHIKAIEAPLYKSYRVYIVNKIWWWNIEVHLGICSEKIEINPITQKNSKLKFVKQVPVSHSMDSLVSCEETKSRGNKGTFRVVYYSGFGARGGKRSNNYSNSSFSLSSSLQSSPSFKHYDFEAEKTVTEEIIQKINVILNLRTGQSRMDYLLLKKGSI